MLLDIKFKLAQKADMNPGVENKAFLCFYLFFLHFFFLVLGTGGVLHSKLQCLWRVFLTYINQPDHSQQQSCMTNNRALCLVLINVRAASLNLKNREVKCYYCILCRLQFLCLEKKTGKALVRWYTSWIFPKLFRPIYHIHLVNIFSRCWL